MASTTTDPRRLILCMSASLDGFLAREAGVIDWLAPSGEVAEAAGAARHLGNLELLGRAGLIVLGRGAYEEMAAVWSRTESPMGRLMNIVCVGGARFAHSLARSHLIDEYRLTIHPVALGEGLPLWHGLPEPQRFSPIAATTYPDGAVTHVLAAKN